MRKILFLSIFIFFVAEDLMSDESSKLYDDSQVAVVKISVDPENLEWMFREENLESDSCHMASVSFTNAYIDTVIDSVGFRLRGNTSRRARKKSFKLSFNEYIGGREFYGVDKLNLNGEHNDPSIVRSKLCWDLFRDIGAKASRAAHTAVYINNVYYGLYVSVEHVDDEFLKKNFEDDSGNLWKCLYPADLTLIGNGKPENYYPDDQGRPYELKTNEDGNDYYQLARLIYIINRVSPEASPDSLEKIMDIPSLLKYFAVNVLTGSWDDYWYLKNNFYLYHHPKEDKFYMVPYDYDNTFGIDWFDIDWANRNPYDFGSDEPRPLAEVIMENERLRDLFSHFLDFYHSRVFNSEMCDARIDSLKEMITPFAEADSFRVLDYGFSLVDFNQSYSSESYVNRHVGRGVKEFIRIRNSSLPDYLDFNYSFPIVYQVVQDPFQPRASDSIEISVSVFSREELKCVEIHFYEKNSDSVKIFPMSYSPVEQTTRVEESDRWVGGLSPLGAGVKGNYKIIAENVAGGKEEYPRSGFLEIQTPGMSEDSLLINEILAKNASVNTDEAGEYEDWIEIYNPTGEDLPLSGMYLTDDPKELNKWRFPFGGVTIPAKGFLLVWCDDDEEQGALHSDFKLDKDGEFIALVKEDGVTVIDSITFGPREEDVSYGRYPDGGEEWRDYSAPTPGARNDGTGMSEKTGALNQFILYRNYPNPFNIETKIEYRLVRAGHVELEVLNNLGRKVAILVDEHQNPGFYTVAWKPSKIGSGVYYYRMKTGNREKTRKMILVK